MKRYIFFFSTFPGFNSPWINIFDELKLYPLLIKTFSKSYVISFEKIEKKIYDFYQNAIINDMQVVGYAYRPIQTTPPTSTSSNQYSSIYLEIRNTLTINYDQISASVQPGASGGGINDGRYRRKPSRTRAVSGIDSISDWHNTEEHSFYEEAVKGQVFLGMATFCFQPKAVKIFFFGFGFGFTKLLFLLCY